MVLERLADITERLSKLDEKVRGGPIAADEWNALVGSVMGLVDVLRDQDLLRNSSLEAKFSPADHDHVGQVTRSWLEPGLSEGLGTGGGGSVEALKAFEGLRKRLDGLSEDMAKLSGQADDQRREVDRFTVSNLDLRTEFTGLDDRFAEIDSFRTSLDAIDGRFGQIREDLTFLEGFSERLRDGTGAEIDVVGLSRDVAGLQDLRSALEGIDGDIVRMRDLEVRIREIETVSGLQDSGGALDDRFVTMRAELASDADTRFVAFEETHTTRLDETLDGRFATFGVARDGAFETFAAERDALLVTRGAEIESSVSARVPAAVAAATDALSAQLRSEMDGRFDSQNEVMTTQIMAAARAAVAPLRTELASEITTGLERQIEERFAGIDANVEGRLGIVNAALAGLDAQVGLAVEGVLDEERVSLQDFAAGEVRNATAGLQDEISASLRSQIATAVAEETADLPAQIDRRVDERFVAVDSRVDALVDERIGDLDARISNAVKVGIEGLDIDGRFAIASRDLDRALAARLADSESRLRSEQTDLLNQNVSALRGEIERARVSAVSESRILIGGTDRAVIGGGVPGGGVVRRP